MGAGHRDEVPSGVPRLQAGRPLREWGGARHRHVHLPLLLHLLDEADHVQAQIVEAETYDYSLMWKETKGSYSCHCVTCCAVLYAINFYIVFRTNKCNIFKVWRLLFQINYMIIRS